MESTITLKRQSELDDIQCRDGELEGYDFLFPSSDDDGNSSDGNNSGGGNDSLACHLTLDKSFPVPSGSRFVAAHRPSGASAPHSVVLLQNGHLAFNNDTLPGASPLAVNPAPAWVTFSPQPIEGFRKVSAIGNWLSILTDTSLFFALWSEKGYLWLGEAPNAPDVSFSAKPKALPPYSMAEGELPRFTVAVSANTDINKAIQGALNEFLANVKKAGLFLNQTYASSAWRLMDGRLWLKGDTQPVGAVGEASLRTVSSSTRDGVTYITMEVARAPFSIEIVSEQNTIPLGWEKAIEGVQVFMAENPDEFPEIFGAFGQGYTLTEIFAIGDRLLGVSANSDSNIRKDSSLHSSLSGFPPACGAVSEFSGEIIHISHSLRPGGSAGFPLYLFCRDGVRELNADGLGYKASRLLSRHVALGANAFAPTPDATLFLSESGVMKISGTSVTSITTDNTLHLNTSSRLLYLYSENAFFLYNEGATEGILYSFQTSKWKRIRIGDALTGGAFNGTTISERHYAWPLCIVQCGDRIGEVRIVCAESQSSGGESTPSIVPFRTRPIKLGSAFKTKQIKEIEGIWADGSRLPVKIYGALRPGRWHHLGTSPKGHMLMRGSGWRFFRINSFAINTSKGYLLPQFFIKFANG